MRRRCDPRLGCVGFLGFGGFMASKMSARKRSLQPYVLWLITVDLAGYLQDSLVSDSICSECFKPSHGYRV